ncbi:actin-like ATPase domain-containing protein [Delitschia confertaspora ATCC 74209]|uniref:Actin-like ATPase domain-containing protein n=1 Tax=Delitschia confertaspora ATCC 74209 TaxID=1513339 RepID=A0A9P4JKA0_9PLEO|nr:actin-like ATPase domain-containing protein [Delitschia confertaspora ATCC 74209]
MRPMREFQGSSLHLNRADTSTGAIRDTEVNSLHESGVSLGETRLVIGVDYGTTYTGIAYATPHNSTCVLHEIDVMTTWGDQMDNHDKVPSVISYSPPTIEGEQQWGSSLSPDAVTMVHTKLELDVNSVSEELDFIMQSLDGMRNLNFQHIRASGNLAAYTHKTPEDVVTDYLTNVFEYLERVVDNFSQALREQITTDIVVTIPTGWSHRAINSTYRALSKAGFNSTTFPKLKEVIFVTEPEAAAIYTARYLRDTQGQEVLTNGGYFILCDAGGGTVDVVSYKVKKLSPSLELEQIGFPTARKCGSVFINEEFKKWLRALIGPTNYEKIDPNTVMGKITSHVTEGRAMRELMEQFNSRKKRFRGGEDGDITLELPAPLDDLTIHDKVDEGYITIKNADMQKFFNVCVGQIVELVKGHIHQIGVKGARPRNIFLVGGFGESEYLQRVIRQTFKMWNVEVRRPDTSWTAVVQGAVICGIEKNTTQNLVKATACQHSYGIKASKIYSDISNNPEDEVPDDLSGLSRAQGQLIWILNKGDVVLSTKPCRGSHEISRAFKKNEELTGRITIYRYSEDDYRPTQYGDSWEELTTACVLDYDLNCRFDIKELEHVRGRSKKDDRYVALLKIELVLDGSNLNAYITFKGVEVAVEEGIMY